MFFILSDAKEMCLPGFKHKVQAKIVINRGVAMTQIASCPKCGSSKVVSEGAFDFTIMECRACGHKGAPDDYQLGSWYRETNDKDLHYCARSLLVGPGEILPSDPVEFEYGEEWAAIGCSRLHCRQCGEMVKIEPDPVTNDNDGRSYACSCSSYIQNGRSRVPDYEDEHYQALPWQCAGHPIADIPLEIDGMIITTGTDAGNLMQRTLSGWSPESARISERQEAVGWAIKLYVRLLDTGFEHGVSRKAAECAMSPDAYTQAAALWFLAVFPESAGAERIEKFVAGDRSFFPNVKDPALPDNQSLEERLLRALGRRIKTSPNALKLAEAEILRPGVSDILLPFLKEHGR